MLVKFIGKRSKLYYVGVVKAVNAQETFVIKFLKLIKKKAFVFPDITDEAEVEKKDVKKVLQPPVIRRGYHQFTKFPEFLNLV